ncbi:hypothetical protein F5B20DRAFT_590807 [Whalleya microplaca]|nr:hypothetical protein F5B20DRAFT_590807 [Whalleya microplaca]
MDDIPSAPDYEPTESVPIVTTQMRELLNIVDEGCIHDVGLCLQDRATKSPDMICMKNLVADEKGAITLPHSAPRQLHRAVILHTVAMQTRLLGNDYRHLKLDIYHNNGPGTYVATIAVADRAGKRLTDTELQKLIPLIERCLVVNAAVRAPSGSRYPQTKEAQELATFAVNIDNIYGKAGYPSTIFIDRIRTIKKVEALVASLNQPQQTAADDMPVASPPCFAGCSPKSIKKRGRYHKPKPGTWVSERANHAWWLVLICMCHMGLEPDVIVVLYIRTWKEGQLPSSETMGTMMTESWVEARGYNIWNPRSTKDLSNSNWGPDMEGDMVWRPYLIDQMEESKRIMQQLDQFAEKVQLYSREGARILDEVEINKKIIDEGIEKLRRRVA